MKLQVLSEHLQKKLPFVFKAISPRTQLPVLQNMLLIARNGTLQVSGTDLEIGISVSITASIEEEGEITIPAKSFIELISTLPKEKVTLETKEKTLHISTKHTKSLFQTITAEEFPKLYEEKGQEVANLSKKDLQKSLIYVLFSASIDTTRAALSGIYVKKDEEDEKKFFFVATDGYRLSLKYNTISLNIEKPLLISARVLRELLILKEGGEENIKIYVIEKSNQVLFEDGDTIIVGRLIEAQFPSYEKIIPQDVVTKAIFDRQDLIKAVKMCSIFARESANIVKFSVTTDAITVSANAPQTGENAATVEAKVTGDDNEIAFNVRYLLELLGNIEEDEMIFEMTNPTSPGVFKIKGDPTFLHLIMPIRVQTA